MTSALLFDLKGTPVGLRNAWKRLAAATLLALSSCTAAPPVHSPAAATVAVAARSETAPVDTLNSDAADDPAIWRNSENPEASLIVATDKKSGLYVYGLDGRVRHFERAGLLNNVDLADLGDTGIIVVASDRNDPASAKLQIYRLQPSTGRLEPLGAVPGGAGEAYGLCLWNGPSGLFAFSVLKQGAVHQVKLELGGPAPVGTIVRTLNLATQPEGCVVDPRTALLYVGEEDRGIWRFDARPDGPAAGTLVAPVDGVQLVADVEGLALAPDGADGGYLVASSQGDYSFALYSLPGMQPAGRFRIVGGPVGSVEETDGIELALGPFGPLYPGGLLVVQDGENAPLGQNFKMVSWDDVLAALRQAR